MLFLAWLPIVLIFGGVYVMLVWIIPIKEYGYVFGRWATAKTIIKCHVLAVVVTLFVMWVVWGFRYIILHYSS